MQNIMIYYCLCSCCRIFSHDTITSKGLQNVELFTRLTAFKQGGIFISLYLLCHGLSFTRSHPRDLLLKGTFKGTFLWSYLMIILWLLVPFSFLKNASCTYAHHTLSSSEGKPSISNRLRIRDRQSYDLHNDRNNSQEKSGNVDPAQCRRNATLLWP